MDQLRLALPASLQHLADSPFLRQHPVDFLPEIYENSDNVSVQQSHLPLIIVLQESNYRLWLAQQPDNRHADIEVILIEENLDNDVNLDEQHRVLAWIDHNVSTKRWGFAIAEAAKAFDSLLHLKELEQEVEYKKFELSRLNEIGIALSAEKSLDALLDLIVTKAMELTHADAGSLYLIESIPNAQKDPEDYFKGKRFRFEVAKNYSRDVPFKSFVLPISKKSIFGYVAIEGKSLLIQDAYYIDPDREYSWGGIEFDKSIQYRTKSMLTVPMFNHEDTVIGVIQLINCKKDDSAKLGPPDEILDQVVSFTPQHARAIQSIASQAAVALQNKKLLDSIQALFDGFINASVKAIESRDPTTSGHSSRVAALTVGLAEAINRCTTGRFADVHFTGDQVQEIRYASLLHDFGKIGVREQVLVKAKKLYPYEAQTVYDRFKLIRQSLELQASREQIQYFMEKSREEALVFVEKSNLDLQRQLEELDDYLKFIIRCNEPTVLAQGGFERLEEIAQRIMMGSNDLPIPYLSPHEMASLSVPKGTLTQQDRSEIESHVTHTYRFLSIIPWTRNLHNVPKIAYAHHEKLNGAGYPLKLKSDEIPLESKMMTIADIYDALTAWDRPYKKAIPAERALKILGFEAKDSHVDADLLQVFIEAKLFQIVARPAS